MNKDLSNDAILSLLRTAVEAPLPDGLLDKATAVSDATRKAQEHLGFETLVTAALFCDDAQAAHPHLDKAMIFRTAGSVLIRMAALVVRCAKRMEGSDLDPAKFALVNFKLAHDLMQIPSWAHDEVLDRQPGQLRRELLESLAEQDAEKYGPVLAAEILALPARLRRYVHDLEQRADPAHDVRRAFVAEEKAMGLEVLLAERDATIAELRQQWLARSIACDPSLVEDAERIEAQLSNDMLYGAAQLVARLLRALRDSQAEVAELRTEVSARPDHEAIDMATSRAVLAERELAGLRNTLAEQQQWARGEIANVKASLREQTEKRIEVLAELRKPVAVERNPMVEKIRQSRPPNGLHHHLATIHKDGFVSCTYCRVPWPCVFEESDLILSAYDALASDNAAWQRASVVWKAEMEELREQLTAARDEFSGIKGYLKPGESAAACIKRNREDVGIALGRLAKVTGERDAAQQRERQLRETITSLCDRLLKIDDIVYGPGSADERLQLIGEWSGGFCKVPADPNAVVNTDRAALAASPAPAESDLDADDKQALKLCSDCPPADYPNQKTRCATCPLRQESSNA
jgi:hypothetical protein